MGRMILLLAMACALRAGEAQPAAVAGKVTDQAGRVAQGARVRLTNLTSGAVRDARTDDDGIYAVRELDAGSY